MSQQDQKTLRAAAAPAPSARADGAGAAESRRKRRLSAQKKATAVQRRIRRPSPAIPALPVQYLFASETASSVQLRALLLSASVAPWSASRARVEIEVIVSLASCSLA